MSRCPLNVYCYRVTARVIQLIEQNAIDSYGPPQRPPCSLMPDDVLSALTIVRTRYMNGISIFYVKELPKDLF